MFVSNDFFQIFWAEQNKSASYKQYLSSSLLFKGLSPTRVNPSASALSHNYNSSECINYFSVALTKHQDQGHLWKKRFILAYSGVIKVHHGDAWWPEQEDEDSDL